MVAEDRQIQVWAEPADNGPRVVFGARCLDVGGDRARWQFWRTDGGRTSLIHGDSIHDAVDDWSVEGEDGSWDAVEIRAASASVAAKLLDKDPAVWRYQQYWRWRNNGRLGEGQIGTPASLKNVTRVKAIESFRRYLLDPSSWTIDP